MPIIMCPLQRVTALSRLDIDVVIPTWQFLVLILLLSNCKSMEMDMPSNNMWAHDMSHSIMMYHIQLQ